MDQEQLRAALIAATDEMAAAWKALCAAELKCVKVCAQCENAGVDSSFIGNQMLRNDILVNPFQDELDRLKGAIDQDLGRF